MSTLNRRQALQAISSGLGSLAFTAMTTGQAVADVNPLAPRETHFPARAKRVIMLFMNGAPSHVDTLDYKPALIRAAGQSGDGSRMMAPIAKFQKRGKSGLWISDLFPNVADHADDLCLIRSMYSDQPNHPTAERAAHFGSGQFVRPSLGAWSVYGLGTENADLPGFVHMGNPGRAGRVNVGSSFLPPGTRRRVSMRARETPVAAADEEPAATLAPTKPFLISATQRSTCRTSAHNLIS